MAEDAGAADLIAGGRLQLGISRGSPEQVIDGWRYFGYAPAEGDDRRRHGAPPRRGVSRRAARRGLRQAEPAARCSRTRPACCASSRTRRACATASGGAPAPTPPPSGRAKLGMNLQSSTLKIDESGKPFHVQQAEQIRAYREAWKAAGHSASRACRSAAASSRWWTTATARISARGGEGEDQIGFLGDNTRAIFGRSYAAEPDELIEQLKQRRGDRRGRHAAADRAQPARRRLQRPRHRVDPEARRARRWAGADAPNFHLSQRLHLSHRERSPSASEAGEGLGAYQQGEVPSPGLLRNPTSPQRRGEVKRPARKLALLHLDVRIADRGAEPLVLPLQARGVFGAAQSTLGPSPSAPSFSFTCAEFPAALNQSISRASVSFGVLAGARMPFQLSAS